MEKATEAAKKQLIVITNAGPVSLFCATFDQSATGWLEARDSAGLLVGAFDPAKLIGWYRD